jgi:serine/threonine-protein kinase
LASLIGQTVLNYRLTSLLAEGGMGAVYVGEHLLLGRRVAIKVVRPELADDPRAVECLVNEARAADRLSHPNIVQLLDAGTHAERWPYLVMELLQGHSLAARLRGVGRIGVREAMIIARQAADALTAAHRAGIVHRDLKPDNLFLVADAGGVRVKLLDFGIAKLRERSAPAASIGTGAVMGTPLYMSPEQCLGRSAEIDQRTDVYALGIILFEMLCGAPPFVAEGIGEVLLMHMTEPPPSPRARNQEIPVALDQLIVKALAKDKQARFASMAELEEALAAIPVPADPADEQQPVLSAAASPSWDSEEPITTLTSMNGTMADIQRLVAPRRKRGTALAAAVAAAAALPLVMVGHPGPSHAPAAVPPAPATKGACHPEPEEPLATLAPPPVPPPEMSEPPAPAVPAPQGPPQEERLRAVPPPAAAPEPCTITVGSKPWAEVWIDGKNTGALTPLVNYEVPCGLRELTLKNSDLSLERSESVTIKPGQRFKKVFEFADLEP